MFRSAVDFRVMERHLDPMYVIEFLSRCSAHARKSYSFNNTDHWCSRGRGSCSRFSNLFAAHSTDVPISLVRCNWCNNRLPVI